MRVYTIYMNHSSWKMAASATLHCLAGCAIGEVVGMVLGMQFGLSNSSTIILATVLAFISGYSLSTLPLVRNGLSFLSALKLVFAADTLSIATMEIVDNSVMWLIPGAMDAHFGTPFFWLSMAIALASAFVIAWPVNYLLLRRGRGHALTHHHMHSNEYQHHVHHHE